MTYNSITKTAAMPIITTHIGSNVANWERYYREMYYYNPTTKLAQLNIEGDAGGATVQKFQEGLVGLFPTSIKTLTLSEGSVRVDYSYSVRIDGKTVIVNCHTIIYMSSGVMIVTHFNGQNHYNFTLNKDLYVRNGTIASARNRFQMSPDSTSEEVIYKMATQEWKMRYDAPQYQIGDIETVIESTSVDTQTSVINIVVKKGLETINPIRTHIEVWPTTPIQGLPSNPSNDKCGAQFPYEQVFTLSTNLRNRKAYQMMGGAPYKVKCWATIKEDDGDDYSVYSEKIVNISDVNPFTEA